MQQTTNAAGAYTRGWESLAHWTAMLRASLGRQALVCGLVGVLVAGAVTRAEFDTRARAHFGQYVLASAWAAVWPTRSMRVTVDGVERKLPAHVAVEVLRPVFGHRSLAFVFRQVLLRAFGVIAVAAPLLAWGMVRFGRRVTADRHRRGAKLVDTTVWSYRHRRGFRMAALMGAGSAGASALVLAVVLGPDGRSALPELALSGLATISDTVAAILSPAWDGARIWCSSAGSEPSFVSPATCYELAARACGRGLVGLTVLTLVAGGAGAYGVGYFVARRVPTDGAPGELELAGVLVPRKREVYHLLVAGATGAGKSVAITDLLAQIRARSQRAVLLDTSGEYIAKFYRPGTDAILNPFDARSVRWTPWADVRKPADHLQLGQALFPVGGSQKDEFWSIAGSSVFAGLLERLDEWDARRNTYIAYLAERLGPRALMEVLKGTVGERFVDPGAEQTAVNVAMTTCAHLRSFRYLPDPEASASPFSIRQFVEDRADRWLFISMREEDHAVLRPLVSLWLDIAITAVLSLPSEDESLPAERRRRLFVGLDELQALQKLPALEGALLRGRKKGLAVIIGVQSIKGVRATYGRDEADALLGQPQTQLVLRTPEEGTAAWLEAQLGKAELSRAQQSQQMGANPQRDGVSVQTAVTQEAVVLASEIQDLPDLVGYLKTVGRPVMKVAYAPRTFNILQKGFVAGVAGGEPQPPPWILAKQALGEAENALLAGDRDRAAADAVRALEFAPADPRLRQRIVACQQRIANGVHLKDGGPP